MKARILVAATVITTALGGAPAYADCQIANAKLEEAILQKPELQGRANR